MKIDINKDFEEQYKNELWKGFTARELAYAGIALFVAGIIAFGIWKITGLAINIAIYAGIPFMAPIIYLAGKAQGQYPDRVFEKYLVLFTNERTAL